MVPHDLLGQLRPATLVYRARKHPALWGLIWRLLTPFTQHLEQFIVSRNRFLRAFRLADPNNVLND